MNIHMDESNGVAGQPVGWVVDDFNIKVAHIVRSCFIIEHGLRNYKHGCPTSLPNIVYLVLLLIRVVSLRPNAT